MSTRVGQVNTIITGTSIHWGTKFTNHNKSDAVAERSVAPAMISFAFGLASCVHLSLHLPATLTSVIRLQKVALDLTS